MSKVKSYLSLIKFSHTIFAMPFALIGFFIGILSADYGVWNLNKALGWDWKDLYQILSLEILFRCIANKIYSSSSLYGLCP
jgi:4-hydroxybenzoate polyprenyltransferase